MLDMDLFAVTMRKPSILPKIKLEYLLPVYELGLDVESERCREMGEELKKFYFGYSAVSAETILVYLMVGSVSFNFLGGRDREREIERRGREHTNHN